MTNSQDNTRPPTRTYQRPLTPRFEGVLFGGKTARRARELQLRALDEVD